MCAVPLPPSQIVTGQIEKPPFCEHFHHFWFDAVFRDYIIYLLHRVGAMRCPAKMPGCSSGCSNGGTFDGTPKTSPVSTPDDQKKCTAMLLYCNISSSFIGCAVLSYFWHT